MRNLSGPVLLGLAAASVLVTPALGQDPTPASPGGSQISAGSAPPGSPTSLAPAELETVVVTAQKRSESIAEVPYSVSALGGKELSEQHVVNVEDITRATPGVSFGAGANPGMDTVTIRGVSSQGAGATVGLYLDDVPITTTNPFNPSYSGATEPTLFDVDRVEVLRGPQGTLYGAGSMGGTLRYIYNAPAFYADTREVGLDLSGTARGGLNHEEHLVINKPLEEGVSALRFGIDVSSQAGWIDHYTFVPPSQASLLAGGNDSHAGYQDQSGVNSNRTITSRLSFAWHPQEDLQLTFALHGQYYHTGDTSLYYPAVGQFAQDKLVPEPSDDRMWVPSLTVNKDVGFADLTSVTSYFWRENDHHSDGTFFNSDFIEYLADSYYPDTARCGCGAAFAAEPGPSITQQVTRTLSEELRFASKLPAQSGQPYTWIAGLFLSDRQIAISDQEYVTGVRQTFINLYHEDPAVSGFADPFPSDSVFWAIANERERQYAVFGEFSYLLTPALKASAGLRYLTAHTSYEYDEGGYFAQGIPPVVSLANDYHAATPRFSLDYQVNDKVSVYANAAKGYRLGGYIQPIQTTVGLCVADLAALGLRDPGFSYQSDELWSYELGSKSRLFDNRVSINAAVYYIDWHDVQQTFDLSCGSPYTANFGTAASYGGELEVRAKPIPSVVLGLNAGVNHATLTEVQPNVGATAGQHLLNTPEYTASLSAEYDWKPADGMTGYARTDYQWIGPSYGSYITSAVNYYNPSYGNLNAAIGVRSGRYDLALYARNVLNDHTAIQHVSIEQTVSAYALRPFTAGITLNVRI